MTTADDYMIVASWLNGSSGLPGSYSRSATLEAFERIKKKHQGYLDAAARVTELANEGVQVEGGEVRSVQRHGAWAIRKALGDAYLGGPLL